MTYLLCLVLLDDTILEPALIWSHVDAKDHYTRTSEQTLGHQLGWSKGVRPAVGLCDLTSPHPHPWHRWIDLQIWRGTVLLKRPQNSLSFKDSLTFLSLLFLNLWNQFTCKAIRGPKNRDDIAQTMFDIGTWPQTSFQNSSLASTGHTEVTSWTGES